MVFRPLDGIKIVEFTHAVMGPSCGLILGDLGADVVQIEPPDGSPTRRLQGFGSGYYSYFNRNKRSLCIDLKTEAGVTVAKELIGAADVLIENFAPDTMKRLGLDYERLAEQDKRLIYCSMKGFLSGPYEKRPAMDEVVQMMGGLAYMTGPSGRPLRAGSSVIDITGGMFGAIAVLAALHERDNTGCGQFVKSSLFETTAFLMGQHMAWSTIAKTPIPPMPERVSAWAVYQVFATKDEPLFVGIISEKHWQAFCTIFDRPAWLKRAEYKTNNLRIQSRELLLPEVKQLLSCLTREDVMARCEAAGIPFAPIARPEDLFHDRHLNESGGLAEIEFPDGNVGKLPRLPIEWGGERSDVRRQPPKPGEHSYEVLKQWLGYSEDTLADMASHNIIF